MTNDKEIEKRVTLAREVFHDAACQAAASAVCQRLRDAARAASPETLLFIAKAEADETHGNATPEQVAATLNRALHFLADVVDESHDVSRYLRSAEAT